jgi:hypothetical protein
MLEVAALSVVFEPGIVRFATSIRHARSSLVPLGLFIPVLLPPLVQFAFIV